MYLSTKQRICILIIAIIAFGILWRLASSGEPVFANLYGEAQQTAVAEETAIVIHFDTETSAPDSSGAEVTPVLGKEHHELVAYISVIFLFMLFYGRSGYKGGKKD